MTGGDEIDATALTNFSKDLQAFLSPSVFATLPILIDGSASAVELGWTIRKALLLDSETSGYGQLGGRDVSHENAVLTILELLLKIGQYEN